MTFRDMTFCASDCTNSACPRHFGEDDKIAAERWWQKIGGLPENGPLIAWSDFRDHCPTGFEYKPEKQ
jgi:hypothetical protein